MKWESAAAVISIGLAGSAGALASTALSQADDEPQRTVTINVAPGPPGPPGPQGEQGAPGPQGVPGPPGGLDCGEGFTLSLVVFNTPGGQQTLKTCLKDE